MGADVLATQVAMASATMILPMSHRINLLPVHHGLSYKIEYSLIFL